MVIMAIVYILGTISGILLMVMIMATWVHKAAKRINEYTKSAESVSDQISMASDTQNRHRLNGKPIASTP